MCACVRACVRTCLRVRACVCVRACVRACVRVYACVHVYAYVHAHTHTQTYTHTHTHTHTPFTFSLPFSLTQGPHFPMVLLTALPNLQKLNLYGNEIRSLPQVLCAEEDTGVCVEGRILVCVAMKSARSNTHPPTHTSTHIPFLVPILPPPPPFYHHLSPTPFSLCSCHHPELPVLMR